MLILVAIFQAVTPCAAREAQKRVRRCARLLRRGIKKRRLLLEHRNEREREREREREKRAMARGDRARRRSRHLRRCRSCSASAMAFRVLVTGVLTAGAVALYRQFQSIISALMLPDQYILDTERESEHAGRIAELKISSL